jgi:hypothetical protein
MNMNRSETPSCYSAVSAVPKIVAIFILLTSLLIANVTHYGISQIIVFTTVISGFALVGLIRFRRVCLCRSCEV